MGSRCLLVTRVSGSSRVPLPPARISPFTANDRSWSREPPAYACRRKLERLAQVDPRICQPGHRSGVPPLVVSPVEDAHRIVESANGGQALLAAAGALDMGDSGDRRVHHPPASLLDAV